MDEKLIKVAMDIILNAGDARNHAMNSMNEIMAGNYETGDEFLSLAKESIKKAHIAQTNVIQDECRGNSIEPSLLFIHAQDTLMSIASEVNLIQKMEEMFKVLKEEIKHGENK